MKDKKFIVTKNQLRRIIQKADLISLIEEDKAAKPLKYKLDINLYLWDNTDYYWLPISLSYGKTTLVKSTNEIIDMISKKFGGVAQPKSTPKNSGGVMLDALPKIPIKLNSVKEMLCDTPAEVKSLVSSFK